jgi:glycosyltransferase involved in cell wall biosynthesis
VRVLHVISDLGTYGAERFVLRLLKAFDEPDVESAALTIAAPRGPRPALRVPLFGADRRGKFDLGFLGRMVGAMRRWRPDVVHTHTAWGKYYGRIAALAAGVPRIVHTEHNSEYGLPLPGLFRAVDLFMNPRTAAVVTFSPTQARRLAREERIPPERIAVIPNGIPLAAPRPEARAEARRALGAVEGEPTIVHVGRLSAVKNQRLALEALARLPGPARLVLIGTGADRPALEALARELGLGERAVFLGYREDAAELLHGADALAVTSLNEAMPLTVIEAMAAGAPVVSAPWAGADDMLGGGAYGLVAPDFSPAGFAAGLSALFADPAAARARAERAQAHARAEYDIRTTVRRHAELYRALSAGTRAASPRMTSARS